MNLTQSNWGRALGGRKAGKQDRFQQLIEAIGQSKTFDMSVYSHTGDTSGCIAGHAAALAGADLANYSHLNLHDTARAWLGLSEEQANTLFAPVEVEADCAARETDHNFVTKRHALAVLRHLADTGNVDWGCES